METQDSFVALIVLPMALALIMASLGLSLTPEDFRRIFVFPRGVSIGLLNLLLISPLLAFGIAELTGLSPVLAIGLVLLGASPGGTMANMLTHLARGDTALSVTMTAISSVAAVLTVPLFLDLATRHFADGGLDTDVKMLGVVARVFLITIIPLSIGMAIRGRWPRQVLASFDRIRKVTLGIFIGVVVAAVISEYELVLDNVVEVAAATLTLNIVAMTISFTIAKLARLDNRQATAISMELGIHNSTLAIAVASTISTDLAIPAAVYSAFMFITAGIFARLMHQRNARAEAIRTEPALASSPS